MEIKINDSVYSCERIITHINDHAWDSRDNVEIILQMSYAEAINLFVSNIEYGYDLDEDTYVALDEYSVAGAITDYRNGLLSIRMGKPTEAEIKEAKLLPIIRDGLKVADDDVALDNIEYFPCFSELMGQKLAKGFRFRYNDELWRIEAPEYIVDMTYVPDDAGVESLFSKVARDAEGTAQNPIQYNNNMELIEGKYYVQNGIIYYCFRNTGIPVYNNLSDLVNIYVELI